MILSLRTISTTPPEGQAEKSQTGHNLNMHTYTRT